MKAGSTLEVCPACGVPAKMFEPYAERISEKRLKILKMDIHPIIVHLPQAFAAFLVILAAALYIPFSVPLHTMLHDTVVVLAAALPFTVLAAFGAGLIDAKIRFRRVTTPILKRKILAGTLFFVFSAIAAALALLTGIGGGFALAAFLSLQVLSLQCGAMLGLWGSTLTNAAFPG